FAGVWAVMMAAMMLPSLVPMAGAYGQHARAGGTGRSFAGTTLFVAGYLVPWLLAGAIAWVVFRGVRDLDPPSLHWDQGGRYVAAAVLAAAALYELTPLKATCLTHCRDRSLLADGWRPGALGALRMGAGQGAYCIGCCGGMMAALFALGV